MLSCPQTGFVSRLRHFSAVWNARDLSGPRSPSVKWGQISSFSRDSWRCRENRPGHKAQLMEEEETPHGVLPPPACPSACGSPFPPGQTPP